MASASQQLSRVASATSAGGAYRLVAVGLAFLAVAFVKPWGGASARAPQPLPGSAAPPAMARATEGAGILPAAHPAASLRPDQIECEPGAWELVSLDRLASWTVRTWIPAVPVPATGPLDPAIPTILLQSPVILSVGACSPGPGGNAAPVSSPLLVAGAWRVEAGRATGLTVEARAGDPRDPSLARLYSPVAGGATHAWPAGRFVLELVSPSAAASPGSASGAWFVAVLVGSPGG